MKQNKLDILIQNIEELELSTLEQISGGFIDLSLAAHSDGLDVNFSCPTNKGCNSGCQSEPIIKDLEQN